MGPTVSSIKTLDFYMMWASVLLQVSIIYLSCQVRLPKYRVSYCLPYWVKCNIIWLLLVSSSFMMTQRKTSLNTVAKVSLILSNLGLKSSLKGHICQTQRSFLSTTLLGSPQHLVSLHYATLFLIFSPSVWLHIFLILLLFALSQMTLLAHLFQPIIDIYAFPKVLL